MDGLMATVELSGFPQGDERPRSVILLVGAAGILSRSLRHAVEAEFPSVLIARCEDIASICSDFGHQVALILIDPGLIEAAMPHAEDILRYHPQAVVAVIQHDAAEPGARSWDAAGSNFIRGVLPMNLRLDVWLAVLRLLMCGGEYFPNPAARARPASASAASNGRPDLAWEATIAGQSLGLTGREFQILELMSRGLQNKSIAAALSRSESTVKIHVHNIIAKLGVHNRNEAAARFRMQTTVPLRSVASR